VSAARARQDDAPRGRQPGDLGEVEVSELASPRAARIAPPRWLDARLVLGVLLVLVAVVAGARVFATADVTTPVYAAAHELVPGEHLRAGDLAVVHVQLHGAGGRYVAAGSAAPIGYVVTRVVGAGELVPVGALAGAAAVGRTRQVTVPVQPGHLPDDLARGDLVDVYVTAKPASGQQVPAPALVVAAVAVEDREGGARTFSGSSTVAVVLSVPVGDVTPLVRAVESGSIDLVRVPPAPGGVS
jgi:hypothetical protein